MSCIRISEKHGVNPATPLCFFCNQPKNELVLAGKLKGDIEAPKNMVWDHNPCDQCQEYMKQGIIVISVKNGESGNNSYRTGGWWVLKENAIKNILGHTPDLLADILKKRVVFMPDEVCTMLGLIKGEKNENDT